MDKEYLTPDELLKMSKEKIIDAIRNDKKRIITLTLKEKRDIAIMLAFNGIRFRFQEFPVHGNYKYAGEFIIK